MALTPINIADRLGNAQAMDQLQDPNGNNMPMVSLDSTRATYRAAANFTPFTTSAVTLIQIQGSATKTVRVKRIMIGGVATAVGQAILQLKRGSANGSGGTAVTPTISTLDRGPSAGYPAATAVVTHFTTAAQSAATAVQGPITMANIMVGVVTVPATLALGGLQPLFPENGAAGSAIVLRGTGDFLEVQNVTPTNLTTGGVYCYFVEWEEDNS